MVTTRSGLLQQQPRMVARGRLGASAAVLGSPDLLSRILKPEPPMAPGIGSAPGLPSEARLATARNSSLPCVTLARLELPSLDDPFCALSQLQSSNPYTLIEFVPSCAAGRAARLCAGGGGLSAAARGSCGPARIGRAQARMPAALPSCTDSAAAALCGRGCWHVSQPTPLRWPSVLVALPTHCGRWMLGLPRRTAPAASTSLAACSS